MQSIKTGFPCFVKTYYCIQCHIALSLLQLPFEIESSTCYDFCFYRLDTVLGRPRTNLPALPLTRHRQQVPDKIELAFLQRPRIAIEVERSNAERASSKNQEGYQELH